MTTTTTAPARGKRGWVIAAIALLVLGLIAAIVAAFIFWPGLTKSDEERRADAQQCVSAYLVDQGFLAEEFTTDLSVTDGDEVFESGDGQFRDQPVLSSEELESWLASEDARAQLAAARVNEAITGIVDLGWVGVKFLTPVTFVGNTGVVNGQVESFGNRASDPGEIFFYPVNLATCQVIEGIVIRAGCANPGERVEPPCRETECLEPKDPSQDPGAQGNAPDGRGPNADPGPGEYIAPEDMVQPPAEPRVNPTPPPPAPPAPSPAPDPDPVPTPDAAPPPPPQPSAPPPSAPETGCVPIPGVEDCS